MISYRGKILSELNSCSPDLSCNRYACHLAWLSNVVVVI